MATFCLGGRLLVVLLFLSTVVSSDKVYGCGGFVEVSRDLSSFKPKPLNLQFVRMELYTIEGVLKDSTECAPNGYYFLPLYDKGTFRIEIKGPEGYAFAPSQVVVEEGRCDGKDINFQLTGFTLSGKVMGLVLAGSDERCNSTTGPEGVTVQLKGKAELNVPGRSTITTQHGTYSFLNVIPGDYVITASHPSWEFTKPSISIRVEWGNTEVVENFIVTGYNIGGRVATVSGDYVSGVQFLLFDPKHNSNEFKCQQSDVELPQEHEMGNPVCVVRSDVDGRFVFRNVPCGEYQVVPFYKDVHTTFDVAPAKQIVDVHQSDSLLKDIFTVVGFSVVGRVIDANGHGIPDVTIMVDTQERATTDTEGYYMLDKVPVSSVTHDIEASKDHLFFDSLLQYQLTPSQPRLPDIRVTSYHICGKIVIEQRPTDVHLVTHREVVLVSKTPKKEERRSAEPSGNYCFELHPGDYTISPLVSAEEQKAGLLFTPSAASVTVSNMPLLDVNFKQVLVSLSGAVRCIESPCDPAISVVLSARGRSTRLTTGLGIGIAPIGEEPATTRNEDYFVFRDVFPGVYEIQVNRDAWCWEASSYVVDVKGDKFDVQNSDGGSNQQQFLAPDFVQSGYVLTTLVSHDINLKLDLEGTSNEKNILNVTKGTNHFCLDKPGVYTLSPHLSCYRFEQPYYKYDTSAPHVLDLIVAQYMINGSLILSTSNPPATLLLNVKYISAQEEDLAREERSTATLISTSGTQATYSWAIWAFVLDVIEVTPLPYHHLLFYPPSQIFTLQKPECPSPLPPIFGRDGKYIIGHVSPALGDVKIQIINTTSDETVVTIYSLPNGTYMAGPLYDDVTYRVVAEKDGYELTSHGAYNFLARKLAAVHVTVNALSTESSTLPLQGVLLSLSGEGYRNNNATRADGGFSFSALSSGMYFLRPLLKEYTFEPASMSVEVEEGEEKRISFIARRIAFSVYGSVRTLNGEGEKWVIVEAVGPKGEREETQTDTQGAFRLRGLVPGVTYTISVKPHPERIERASPESYTLSMPAAEIHDIHFVVFRRPPKSDLTGEVFTDPLLLPSLWVELYQPGNNKVLASRRLGPSGFFDFSGLCKENEEYLLRVATSLSRQAYAFATVEQAVYVNGPAVHVPLSFSASPNQVEKDVPQTPLYALAVAFVALVVAVYYQTKAA